MLKGHASVPPLPLHVGSQAEASGESWWKHPIFASDFESYVHSNSSFFTSLDYPTKWAVQNLMMKALELTAKAYQGLPIQRVSAIDRAYSIRAIHCFKFEWHDSILCLKALGIFLGWQPLGSYLDTLWLIKIPYRITSMRSQPGPRLAPPPTFCRDFEYILSVLSLLQISEVSAKLAFSWRAHSTNWVWIGPRKARRRGK